MTSETVTADFRPAGRQRWLSLVEKALDGSPFESLVARTDDGLPFGPVYERGSGADFLPRREPQRPWTIVQRIDDPDPVRANRQALDDLEGGATGIALIFEGAPNAFGYGLPATEEGLEAVLDGVPLGRVHLRIDAHPSSRAVADWLVASLGRRRADPGKLSISFGIDPAAVFAGTGRLRMSVDALQASMPQSLSHFFAMGVPGVLLEADGRVFHNAGATEAQELGLMLASAASHLRLFENARQALVHAVPHIGFATSVDQDQFLSTAKIRALRKLWAKVQECCSVESADASVHAETSYRMVSAKDPETNILRATIAAFAAAVGGADTISILPHSIAHGLPDPLARRVARNTQLVLASEAHLDFAADPAAGSGGIEALTDALCEAAWSEFQAIEAEGGIMRSLETGGIQARIVEARTDRSARYRAGRRQIVGTTLFPAGRERPVATLAEARREPVFEGAVTCERLEPIRIDQSLEDRA